MFHIQEHGWTRVSADDVKDLHWRFVPAMQPICCFFFGDVCHALCCISDASLPQVRGRTRCPQAPLNFHARADEINDHPGHVSSFLSFGRVYFCRVRSIMQRKRARQSSPSSSRHRVQGLPAMCIRHMVIGRKLMQSRVTPSVSGTQSVAVEKCTRYCVARAAT